MEMSKGGAQGGVLERPEQGITPNPGRVGPRGWGGLGGGLRAPAVENHRRWPAGWEELPSILLAVL